MKFEFLPSMKLPVFPFFLGLFVNLIILALEKRPDQVWLHQQVSYKRGSRLLYRWLRDQRRQPQLVKIPQLPKELAWKSCYFRRWTSWQASIKILAKLNLFGFLILKIWNKMFIIKWLVLISGERVLREFGSCRWKVGWRWSGWTFCALDHDRFFEASLFGHLLAFLVRNHLTFVVKFRFAMSGHFGYVKGMTGTKSSWFTSNIVDVLLDLLLLWPLFHLTMTFFELTAFIFIDLKKRSKIVKK